MRKKREEEGIAMVVALCVLLLLSVLSAGIVFVVQSGVWSTANYKALTQARFQSEAGLQRTLWWFNTGYIPYTGAGYSTTTNPVQYGGLGQNVSLSGVSGVPSNYPTSAVITSYGLSLGNQTLNAIGIPPGSGYSTQSTLLRTKAVASLFGGMTTLETWHVQSLGTIPGARRATVQSEMDIERGGVPVFQWAFYGTGTDCGNVLFGGGGGTDSFDSSLGTYAGTVQQSDGDVGSNGNLDLTGGSIIHGQFYSPLAEIPNGDCKSAPDALSLCSGCSVTEPISQLTVPTIFDPPPAINPLPPTGVVDLAKKWSLAPGCGPTSSPNTIYCAPGSYPDLKLGGGWTLQVSEGNYKLNSLELGGGAVLQLTSWPVTMNFAGTGITGSGEVIKLGGGTISNPSGIPSNLIMTYAGPQQVELSGGSGSYGLLYAPNAQLLIGGSGGWYGAAIGKSLKNTGGSMLHYDRALGTGNTVIKPGPFRPISYSRSKY